MGGRRKRRRRRKEGGREKEGRRREEGKCLISTSVSKDYVFIIFDYSAGMAGAT